MHEDILNFKWDKFVGRRQPPLRGFLVYEGLVRWLNEKFDYDFSNLFLFFSIKKDGNVITDSFVNVELKNKLLELITNELNREVKSLYKDLKQFRKDTKKLLEFSKDLTKIKESDNPEILFDKFCELWKNFAPSLWYITFLDVTLENAIIKYQKDKLLKELMQFREWRKTVYENCWYGYSKNFFRALGKITGLNENIDWVTPSMIKRLIRNKKKINFESNALVFFDITKLKG